MKVFQIFCRESVFNTFSDSGFSLRTLDVYYSEWFNSDDAFAFVPTSVIFDSFDKALNYTVNSSTTKSCLSKYVGKNTVKFLDFKVVETKVL